MHSGRTWQKVKGAIAERIKNYLLKKGGWEEAIKNPYEVWRVKFFDATLIYYKKGTLYSPPSNDSKVITIWSKIAAIAGPKYILPTKDFLLGLDETGKGEIIGPTILTGVLFPAEIFPSIDSIIGPADTKKKRSFAYWDRIFEKLIKLKEKGFIYINQELQPRQIDKYNLNRLIDRGYQKIINRLLKNNTRIENLRLVLDDYQIGALFRRDLDLLKKKGTEVIIEKNADEKYLEVKTAAIVSKRFREKVIEEIKRNPKYQIAGMTIGSGNPGDKETREWLKTWYASYGKFPWFVKESFKTIKEMFALGQ